MAEGKSESQSKIRYEQIADMGSGLIIARVPAECIREQDINAVSYTHLTLPTIA